MLNTSTKRTHSINYTYIIINTLTHVLAPIALSSGRTFCTPKNSDSFMLTKIDISEESAKGAKTLTKLIT